MLKLHWVGLGLVCGVVACGADDDGSSNPDTTSGGAGALGVGGVGGMVTAGGTTGVGGSVGGMTGVGGSSGGGGVAAGGGPGTGATTGTGGSPGDGGSSSSGGSVVSTGGTSGGAGGTASGGVVGSGGAGGTSAPVCKSTAPAEFQANTALAGGSAQFKESPHFRINGSASATAVDTAINHLEAAHACFVEGLCFRTTGLSSKSDAGPYYKTNINVVGNLGSAAGVMRYDAPSGFSYLEVISSQVILPRVTVHEWGHGVTLSEYNWVDQKRTGAWWETVANWVADTYLTSTYCDAARKRFGIAVGTTVIDLNRVIGQSYLLIVSTQNYYEAWPFLTYLTSNPDSYPGLGLVAIQNLFRQHTRNNDTPLHVLEKVAAPIKVQTILGRYWAHMAYLDIGHQQAKDLFFSRRGSLNFANLDPAGSGTYRVKAARKPQYGGANIVPLTGTGEVSVQVKNLGNGRTESNFTATLVVRSKDGPVRYVDLPDGAGKATVGPSEEASLVVANTPNTLYQYDAFETTASSPESIGLNYEVQINGATPAN